MLFFFLYTQNEVLGRMLTLLFSIQCKLMSIVLKKWQSIK